MFALVDNKMNRCWAFQETKQEVEDILALQQDPSFYRVEKVKKEDYFDEDGRLITQKFQGQYREDHRKGWSFFTSSIRRCS